MEEKITSEEANARLALAEQIIQNFPFLAGHFRVQSVVTKEGGVFNVQIFQKTLEGEMQMETVIRRFFPKLFDGKIADLIKENEELKNKLSKYENKIPTREHQTFS